MYQSKKERKRKKGKMDQNHRRKDGLEHDLKGFISLFEEKSYSKFISICLPIGKFMNLSSSLEC